MHSGLIQVCDLHRLHCLPKEFSGRGIEGGRAVRELMRYSVKPTPSGMGNHASAFFLTRVTTDAKGISRCVMDIWGCPGQRPCNRMKVA